MTSDLRTELLEDIRQNPGIASPELRDRHSDCNESSVSHNLTQMHKRGFVRLEVDRAFAKGRGCWRYWLAEDETCL